MSSRIINAKLEDWSLSYDGPKFHACLCDPPYDLAFMGKAWDTGANFKAWGEAILPHLYPGALVLMFGGTRTWHRLACGMEDAGFEMWDTLMWLHGQGFPKAQDISKLIDKANGDEREVIGRNPNWRDPVNNAEHHARWNNAVITGDITKPTNFSAPWSGHKTTALKPSWEPVLCFKKPLTGTYAEMAMQYGSGALNVDGGRIPSGGEHMRGEIKSRNEGTWAESKGMHTPGRGFVATDSPLGRYPANLILDPESAALLDEQTGNSKSPASYVRGASSENVNAYGRGIGEPSGKLSLNFGDSGGASRFYYCSKASSSERNAGLEGFEAADRKQMFASSGSTQVNGEWVETHSIPIPKRNNHPCCKPIDLCRYLATLLLPPESVQPRRLLVPFAGSGSEMIGATRAGWDEIVGIEQNAEYCDLSPSRIVGDAPLFNTVENV